MCRHINVGNYGNEDLSSNRLSVSLLVSIFTVFSFNELSKSSLNYIVKWLIVKFLKSFIGRNKIFFFPKKSDARCECIMEGCLRRDDAEILEPPTCCQPATPPQTIPSSACTTAMQARRPAKPEPKQTRSHEARAGGMVAISTRVLCSACGLEKKGAWSAPFSRSTFSGGLAAHMLCWRGRGIALSSVVST